MKQEKKKKKKLKSGAFNFLIILVLLTGIAIMLYPSFANWYNSLHQSRVVMDYNQTVENNDNEVNQQLWNEAKAYNYEISQSGVNFTLSDEEKERYNSVLDVSGTGVMGYIQIDKINVSLPIYHDTSEGVLQVAVGHLAGTSLPVGGNYSHSVITGHTGLPSARLFTDIDQLEKGDTFQIVILNHILTYQVNDIRVVLPDELDSLQIQGGQDLCTLVTCTPYGINTHRLLVTGTRIPNPPGRSDKAADNTIISRSMLPVYIAIGLIVILVILIILIVRKDRKYKK